MKDKLLQIRISEELSNRLDKTVSELKEKGIQPKATVSDLVRQSIGKWIDIYEDIQDGKTLAVLETQDFYTRDLAELQDILIDIVKEVENQKIRDFITSLDSRLDFEFPRIQKRTTQLKEEIINELEKGDE